MEHCHLEPQARLSAAAIDDIIERGKLADWIALRDAANQDGAVMDKIRRICAARCADPYAQRYHLWRHYAARAALA